jgi:hypothetical protein
MPTCPPGRDKRWLADTLPEITADRDPTGDDLEVGAGGVGQARAWRRPCSRTGGRQHFRRAQPDP